jgi:hypothetical protein
MTIFSGDYQEAVEEVARTAFTMAAVTSRDGNHASMFTKTTFAGASSLSRRLAPRRPRTSLALTCLSRVKEMPSGRSGGLRTAGLCYQEIGRQNQ